MCTPRAWEWRKCLAGDPGFHRRRAKTVDNTRRAGSEHPDEELLGVLLTAMKEWRDVFASYALGHSTRKGATRKKKRQPLRGRINEGYKG